VFTYTDITDSKRTEAEIKRRNAELLALNAVASAINKSLDMKSIFTVVRDELSWSLSFESFLYSRWTTPAATFASRAGDRRR